MLGEKYNYLTVIEEWRNDRNQLICRCRCDCGNESVVPMYKLKSNRIKSCGCMRSALIKEARTKHGSRKTMLYSKWSGIKRRCYNENDSHYKDYGARGIGMCEEWEKSFSAFEKWAKESGYKDGDSLERVDVNKGYCPENCCWISMEDQAKNKRNTVWIIYNGMPKRMAEIADLENIPVKTISSRYYRFLRRHKGVDKQSITYEMIQPAESFRGVSYYSIGKKSVKKSGRL